MKIMVPVLLILVLFLSACSASPTLAPEPARTIPDQPTAVPAVEEPQTPPTTAPEATAEAL